MAVRGSIFNPEDFNAILRRVESVTPNSTGQWGKMNAHQMLVHCSDPIREILGQRPTRNLSSLLLRTLGKWMALYGPEWQKGKFPTSPDYDQQKKGTPPAAFLQDQAELVNLITRFHQLPEGYSIPPHPAFGKMNRKEWGRLGFRHLDHHLRQFGC